MFGRTSRTQGKLLSGALKTDRELRVRPIGMSGGGLADVYHQFLRASWARLSALFVATFLGFNLFFAWLYSLQPGSVDVHDGPRQAGQFWDLFFFSVQTVATIGYGNMFPVTTYANTLVVVEITLGIMMFALVTGVAFARFSRPTARILFSKVAVVEEVEGVPTLMFRAANQRHNLIYEAQVRVSLLSDQKVGRGRMRRFNDLALLRDSNPVFALTWTVMHPIDADSPLHPWLADGRAAKDAEIVVVLTGTDNHTGQALHGRWAYAAEDIRWGHHFVDIIGQTDNGERTINYARFDDVVPAPSGDDAAS
ncbi:ion channel [Novosphingobium tardum]|uniref:Ion channel n=1 Tax=Novosphingobium tardum TaxID=1538021 RepID=A0ABV8RNC5_9SPHN